MLVIMDARATAEQCSAVSRAIEDEGYRAEPVPGANRTAICVLGNEGRVPRETFMFMPGVKEVIEVTRPYKLVSREVHPDDSIVSVGGVDIGGTTAVLMAGPCSVETEERTLAIAEAAKAAGAHVFRAGAYKPRTSPYAFQGLGEEGLRILARVREITGLPVVSEVVDPHDIDIMLEHIDILQVGTRNMANYALLKRLGEVDRPVLLKRGMSASFEEWLQAAEYLLSAGNRRVILCERGIRTFSTHSRNTLDLNVVPLARARTHLPVVVDPSHGVGDRPRVRAMARAALACGAQGLLLEIHTDPDTARSDAQQTIDIGTFAGIVKDRDLLAGLD